MFDYKNFIFTNQNLHTNKNLNLQTKDFDKGYIVKKINDKNHPCYNQFGLYATRDWQPFEIINEYTGELVNIYEKQSNYTVGFQKNGFLGLGIDAQECGNAMRFINHYGGIHDKEPNVKYETVVNEDFIRIYVICIKPIGENDEILADYRFEP